MKFPRLYDVDAAPAAGAGGAAPAAAVPAAGSALVPAPGIASGTPAPAAGAAPAHWSSTYEGLPDAIRTAPVLQTLKTPAEAIKNLVDLQPLIGADKAPIPKDWNDPVQVKAFNSKIGVPEKAADYKLADFLKPKLPTGTVLDEKLVGKFQDWAIETGMTPRQAQIASEKFLTDQIAMHTSATQAKAVEQANALNAFKAERGTAFDTDMAFAQKALINYTTPEFLKFLNTSGLGDNPEMIKAFAKIGLSLKEDGVHPPGTPAGSLQGNDANSARVRVAELKADVNFMKALNSANEPNHKAAVAEWSKLHGMIPAGPVGGVK